jgi:[pyruvate, water dikinase]-phosphate phosphotransferase / [pyruvate, water dikinase] kinase
MAKYKIFSVSGSTGKTVELAIHAALAQFKERDVEVVIYPKVDSLAEIDTIIALAKKQGGMIVHSFVKHELSGYIWDRGRVNNVIVVNMLGPIMNEMSSFFHDSPLEEPGLFSKLNKEYFRRIETTEFALKHDDGANVDDLERAEMVLLGVSRTFKTPLSVYLAFKGWMVANIPIILNLPLPEIVYELPPEKIFCLTTNANALSSLRNVRNEHLKGMADQYSSFSYVAKELNYAHSLYALHPDWAVIRVTAKPIEEIASNIINIYSRM